MKKTALAILLASIAMPSFASIDTTSFSGEVLLGYADHEISEGSFSFSDDAYSYGIRAAYQVNKNFAAEVSYQNLGEAEYGFNNNTFKVDSSALTFGVKGMYPLQNGFSLVGRLGLSFLTLEGDGGSEDYNEVYYGIGAQYDVNEQVYVGVEYTLVGASEGSTDYDIGNFALSAGMRF